VNRGVSEPSRVRLGWVASGAGRSIMQCLMTRRPPQCRAISTKHYVHQQCCFGGVYGTLVRSDIFGHGHRAIELRLVESFGPDLTIIH